MKEKDIENLVLRGFQSELAEKSPSYYYQIFMMTVRSLVPESSGGNCVNYERFSEELKLWTGYRAGGNSALNDFALRGRRGKDFDESAPVRAVPIFIANENSEKAVQEIFKSSYFITENIKSFLVSVSAGFIISEFIESKNFDEMFSELKEILIEINTSELLKTVNKENDKLYIINFERNRIELLQKMDRVNSAFDNEEESEYLKFLKEIYRFLSEESGEDRGLSKICGFISDDADLDSGYLRSIGNYLGRLRKGRISPESLKFEKKDDASVYSLREGERFRNSVLGDSVLKKIEEKDGFELRYVVSKSGKYRFFRKLR